MKHENFKSLNLDDLLPMVLGYCQGQTRSLAAHWISAHGLARVHESSVENWNWALAAADVIGHHMWSTPASDMWSLYQMWTQVDQLFPRPWTRKLKPQMLSQPVARYVLPVYFDDHLLGMVALDNPRDRSPVAIHESIREGLDVAAKYLYFGYLHLTAKNLSYIDEVTGLHNQRYLPMVLEHEIVRSKREKSEFSLLFLDIDYFKMVNDGRGHWVGSKLLVELGKVLRSQVRGCDYTFRYGGDEFIVVLGNANLEDSKRVAERIRTAIEQQSFLVEGHTLNLTVSIGLASYPTHAQTVAGLIQLADQAMYYGKRKSRNIVFVAS
ncbi:MAG: GGDEF domain-containing protein [Bdellovibrionales bacterium]